VKAVRERAQDQQHPHANQNAEGVACNRDSLPPSLPMTYAYCVCVREKERESVCVYLCARACDRVCVSVCICVRMHV